MLTNYQGISLLCQLKQSFFLTQMILLSNKYQQHFIIHMLIMIIKFIISNSIYFIIHPFYPEMINQIFRLSLFSQLTDKINVNIEIVKIILIIMMVILILGYMMVYNGVKNSFIVKSTILLLNIFIILIVPITYLLIYQTSYVSSSYLSSSSSQLSSSQSSSSYLLSSQSSSQSSSSSSSQLTSILSILIFILFVICFIISSFYLLFFINPFHKYTTFIWNLSNLKQYYYFLFNIITVFVLVYDNKYVPFFIGKAIFDILLIIGINKQNIHENMSKKGIIMTKLEERLRLLMLLGLIISQINNNNAHILATQIWLLLNIIIIFNFLNQYYILSTYKHYFPLCNSDISQFYSFYFYFLSINTKSNRQQSFFNNNNKNNNNNNNNSQNSQILDIHILYCRQKNCFIKNYKLSHNNYISLQDIEILCNMLIQYKSNQSERNQIIKQIWKFQTGNKYKFRIQMKQISIFYQFIVFYAQNLSKFNQVSDSISEENVKMLKSIFYQKFQNCLLCYSMFYGEISKAQPKLQTILSLGADIKFKANQLKNMYNELLKHSAINFKTAQLYVQFENFFIKKDKNNSSNQKIIDRMKKIQKNKNAQNIDEIYLPTLSFYSQTGIIQNMNTECLSFFKMTRFQIKSRKLGQLLYPQVSSISQVKQRLKSIKGYTFFNKNNQVDFGSISIKQKYVDNKKFDIVIIQRQIYSDFKNIFLIDRQSKDIICLLKQQSYLKISKLTTITIKWRLLYETYLSKKIQQLINQRVLKLKIQQYESSLFVMNYYDSIHKKYIILNVKFMKDLQRKKKRISSYIVNTQNLNFNINKDKSQGEFCFHYSLQNEYGPLLIGENILGKERSTRQISVLLGLQRQMNNKLVMGTILQQNRFSKGIKTYRLYDNDLYNIDLQDKQKYVQQFTQTQNDRKNNNKSKQTQKDLYLFALLLFIVFGLIGLSIFLNIKNSQVQNQVYPLFSRALKISQFKLYTNRIASIMRDIKQKRYEVANKDWKVDILYSYYKLKDIRAQTILYSSNDIVVTYRNLNYTGTLNQFMDVLLTHIYSLTQQYSLKQIQFFQQIYLSDINYRIVDQRIIIGQNIKDIMNSLINLEIIIVMLLICVVIVFYVLLIWLIIVLNKVIKDKLNLLMMMSDTEARMKEGYADKLAYALDMVRKNFDVDLKIILGPIEHHKLRKKPKQISVGMQKKAIILIIILIGLGFHIGILYTLYSQFCLILQNILKICQQSENIIQTYSMYIGVTNRIYYSQKIQLNSIKQLRQKVNFLSQNRGSFIFDQQTNQQIDKVFYQSSCDYLNQNKIFDGDDVNCTISMPGYMVENPFDLGLIAYFSRAHYNILDNITDNFGSTGIYSKPFIKIFANINQQIRVYGKKYAHQRFSTLLVKNIICVAFGFVYLFITVILFLTLKNTTNQISQILKFLNYGQILIQKLQENKQIEQSKQKRKSFQNSKDQQDVQNGFQDQNTKFLTKNRNKF